MTLSSDDPRTPLTNAGARARGVTREALKGSAWRVVFRGVHVRAGIAVDLRVRCEAALALHPSEAHLSHATAAEILGVPIQPEPEVHVTVHRRRDRYYRAGVRPHFRTAPSECLMIRGLPVSAPLQMFVELAGSRSLVDAVIAGDFLVRRRWITREKLVADCEAFSGKHAKKARRAARLVRDGVDSAMETRLRLLIVLGGLPEPTINFKVYDDRGELRRRFELSYPENRLIIEFDGRHHIERVEQWEDDLDRREEIEDNEWRILVVVSRGIFREPARTLHRIGQALERRGGRPPRISDGWMPHFPPR